MAKMRGNKSSGDLVSSEGHSMSNSVQMTSTSMVGTLVQTMWPHVISSIFCAVLSFHSHHSLRFRRCLLNWDRLNPFKHRMALFSEPKGVRKKNIGPEIQFPKEKCNTPTMSTTMSTIMPFAHMPKRVLDCFNSYRVSNTITPFYR